MFAFVIREENERCESLAVAMSRNGRAEIDVGDDLAVDDDEGLFVQLIADVIQRAGRAEYFRLFDRVIDSKPVIRSVSDLCAHRIGFVMQIDDQFLDAVALRVFDRVWDEGAVEKRERGFGSSVRQRPQARPEPGCQNHCFHFYLSWRGTWSVSDLSPDQQAR